MQQQRERSSSESYFWPSVWALGLHVLMFGMLFVSFAFTPELPPSKPIVQATLYELKSKSPATVQTNQKIAGEAKKTAAKQYEVEQLEAKKLEQQKQVAAKAAEQKKAEEAQKAEAAEKTEQVKKATEAKKAEEKQLADIAKKKTEEEKKKAAAEAKKKADAEAAKKKAVADAKKAADAKKKAAAEASKKKAAEAARKAAEDKKAQALAELLAEDTERQAALGDEIGEQVSGNFDDLIRMRAAEGWTRPPGATNGMTVVLQITMLPDGTITSVGVARSSGNGPFDSSAVAAVENIGRLIEMQGLSPTDFNPYRSFKMTFTPEDLAL
ncbi:cell envelope integrity protein TolA [Pseudomonas sp. 2FG]|uniref:cell envelope integrity protein TolA n=1 Tax=Pseudomonas sp. 2FG TaxID=2502191 RepID=UPI0010F6207E|nr:cell envelope integrity protein TolA [Pseudomonas sp. 2FG]